MAGRRRTDFNRVADTAAFFHGGSMLDDDDAFEDSILHSGDIFLIGASSSVSTCLQGVCGNSTKMAPQPEEAAGREDPPEKKRRLAAHQVKSLEASFGVENRLEARRKVELARDLGLQPRQVAVWFQNRRARWKTKQLEKDYEALKSSFHALQAGHQSLSKEKEDLMAELLSLTGKLHGDDAEQKKPSFGAAAECRKREENSSVDSAAAFGSSDASLAEEEELMIEGQLLFKLDDQQLWF